MMNKYFTLILGTMLGFGILAFSGAGASAAAMLPLAPLASGEANAASDGIVQAKHKNQRMAQQKLQQLVLLQWRLLPQTSP